MTGQSPSAQPTPDAQAARDALQAAKRAVRERIWAQLDEHGAVEPPGAAGHIPAFVGSDAAAGRLSSLDVWQRAGVVKCNPDRAQLPVRVAALGAGKHVYMAVPKLAKLQPFYDLDPDDLPPPYEESASSKGAAIAAPTIGLVDMRPVDLIVCGTVAVDLQGVRIGKGAGYSDLEVALLHDAGLIGPETTIVTTVHDLQVVEDEQLPTEGHDFRVDLIVTPTRVIQCPPRPSVRGIDPNVLTESQRSEIPVLNGL